MLSYVCRQLKVKSQNLATQALSGQKVLERRTTPRIEPGTCPPRKHGWRPKTTHTTTPGGRQVLNLSTIVSMVSTDRRQSQPIMNTFLSHFPNCAIVLVKCSVLCMSCRAYLHSIYTFQNLGVSNVSKS